jgi:hypothetical protein
MGTMGNRGSDVVRERSVFRQYALRDAESVHVLRLVEQREPEAGDLPAVQLIQRGATVRVAGCHEGCEPGPGSTNFGRSAAER